MNQFIISPLSALHHKSVHHLLRQQLEEELVLFQRPTLLTHLQTSDETIQRLIDFWCNKSSVKVLIAMTGDRVQGFISAQIKNDIYNNQDVLSGEVLALYVAKEQRNKGLGTQLLTDAESWLLEQGVYAINVSWLVGNDPSSGLYKKFGFEPVYTTGRKMMVKS